MVKPVGLAPSIQKISCNSGPRRGSLFHFRPPTPAATPPPPLDDDDPDNPGGNNPDADGEGGKDNV